MAEQERPAPRAVIVVSSHVVRGSVGNRAAVFALESLGFPVWAVPTVTLSWHPGHGPSTRIVPPAADFAAVLGDLARSPWLGEVGAVLSGYLGEASQARAVASLVAAVRERNPAALYLCDPVIGDAGGLYVPEATAAAMRDALLPIADIATPNRHELAWLAARALDDNRAIVEAALAAPPRRMVVTSAHAMLAGSVGNLLVGDGLAVLVEHRLVDRAPNGPGDLMAALLLARIMNGDAPQTALQRATAAVFEVMARATGRGSDELMLETDARSLSQPMATVQVRRLADPGGKERA